MNLLNRAAYGSAFRRHGKRLRVLPVLERGEVRTRALRSCMLKDRQKSEFDGLFDCIILESVHNPIADA